MRERYRYMTRSGYPPNQGLPPGVPRSNTAPGYVPVFAQQPPMFHQPMFAAPGVPPPAPPGFCWLPATGPPPPSFQPFAPGPPVYGGYPPAQPMPNPTPLFGAAPPAPGVARGQASTLPPGARIRGEIPVFPNRNSGYIFSKKQCTFNIIEGPTKPWREPGCEIKFRQTRADCRMSVEEFIEALGILERGGPRAPKADKGIVEVIESGDGTWQKGTQITMGDPDATREQTLADVGWDECRGEAGFGKPVWLVLLP